MNHGDEENNGNNNGGSSSQLSQHSEQNSHHSSYSQRSRSSTHDDNQSQGAPFFADMMLDLSEAQMEMTPRTDLKFASMANSKSDGDDGKEDLIDSMPPMPLIVDENATANATNIGGAENNNNDNNGGLSTPTNNNSSGGTAMEPSTPTAERSFMRIESNSPAILHNRNYNRHNSGSGSSNYSLPRSSTHSSAGYQRPSRLPRRPRDVSWTAAALLLLPVGLLLPHLWYSRGYTDRHNHKISCGGGGHCTPHHPSWALAANSRSTHSTVFLSTLSATVFSLLILKSLYSSPGGGEGDDTRHVNVTRTLMLGSNLVLWMNPLLVVSIWHYLPHARAGIILPLGLMVRDAWRVRRGGSALPIFRGRRSALDASTHANRVTVSVGRAGIGMGTAPVVATGGSSSHDRKTFFRALAIAALDILSRSLRRKSFVRAASILLLLQFLCVSLWWGSVSTVLSVEVFEEDGFLKKTMHKFWLLFALLSGKWATGTIARLLGFVSAGGVASWFGQQTLIMEERMGMEAAEKEEKERLKQQQQQQQQQQRQQQRQQSQSDSSKEQANAASTEDTSHDEKDNDMVSITDENDAPNHSSNLAAARAARNAMPEAYRTADASAYAYSVMDFDEGLDDDYDEEEDYGGGGSAQYRYHSANTSSFSSLNNNNQQSSSTVKSFLTAGCTVSFGSVAQCGLLGGLAQFLWSCVRNVDNAAMGFVFLQERRRRRRNGGGDSSGFRGMDIGDVVVGAGGRGVQWKQALVHWWRKMDVSIREFVRSHSDLAMSHVAAYFKSYQRAANDVAVLIETSGVESIIHDDITTHMCSSLGHLVAGSLVMVCGMLIITHRNAFSSSGERLADASLLEVLLFSYVLCYTILFTALEPLRAAIKAVYVCFAEHPLSLRQAFPLIYQRLSRISEASGNPS